jgi:hypothetical protein
MTKPKPTLNQADLELLEQRFATKEDLQGFATKKDLQSFATKADLQGFATKDDVRQIVKKELQPVKKELKSIKKDTSDLIDFLDRDVMEISKKVKRIETHPGTSL